MLERQAAGAIKTGSEVKYPVCAYSLRTSMTLGPIEPSSTGSWTDFPVASSVSVIVPLDWATLVLLPSIDAPHSLRPQAAAGFEQRIAALMGLSNAVQILQCNI